MLTQTRSIRRFEAAAGADKLRILLVVEDVHTETISAGSGRARDDRPYVTSEDGYVMYRLGKGVYQDPATGEIFVSADPIAP